MEKPLDVLIVGGGPVGLSLAAMLSREGVSLRIIDMKDQPTVHSKAMGIQSRTIEIFEHLGIEEPFLTKAQKIIGTNVYVGSNHVLSLTMDPKQLPESVHPYGLMLPQAETEEVLISHLANKYQVFVERRKQLIEFQESQELVEAIVTNQHGNMERISARWVIGCDGARSTIRKQLNIPFKGVTYAEQFLLADVLIDWDKSKERVHSWMHKDGMLVALPLPEPHRWRIFASYNSTSYDPEAAPSLSLVEQTFRERTGGIKSQLSDPIWLSQFIINRRLVTRYRQNRILIAGFAAHIHSPIGGQGMNTGIQDAYNLAWKLALVIKGLSDPRLLDSYEEERQPVARGVLKRTGSNTRLLMANNPLVRLFRDRIVIPRIHSDKMQAKMMGEQTNLTVNYRGCSLSVDRRKRPANQIRAGDRLPNLFLPALKLDGERLYESLGTNPFILLLFAESDSDQEARLIEQSIRAEAFHIKLFVSKPPSSTVHPNLDVIFDAESSLALQLLGKVTSGCVLIRPDRYIGFISDNLNSQDLLQYLSSIYTLST